MSYNVDFLKAFCNTMLWEVGPHFDFNDPDTQSGAAPGKCGLVNHSNDPGGLTKFGVSQKAYPNEDIQNMTMYRAMDIYEADYWNKGNCDKLPSVVNSVHFDACVNHSMKKANQFLQRAVGAADDGFVGPKTLKAVQDAVDANGAEFIALKMLQSREDYFNYLANTKPKLQVFLKGWLNRVNGLRSALANGDI